jgi:hypothetical protein
LVPTIESPSCVLLSGARLVRLIFSGTELTTTMEEIAMTDKKLALDWGEKIYRLQLAGEVKDTGSCSLKVEPL